MYICDLCLQCGEEVEVWVRSQYLSKTWNSCKAQVLYQLPKLPDRRTSSSFSNTNPRKLQGASRNAKLL